MGDILLEDGDTSYFCYLIIKSQAQCAAGIAILVLALLIIFYGIRNYFIIKQYNMSKHVTRIYIYVFGWGVFFITKISFAIIIYLTQNSHQNSETLSIMSKYYFIIDILTVYIMQTAVITLPYNWMKNIIGISTQLSSLQNQSDDFGVIGVKFQVIIIKLLRIYQCTRLIILLPIIPFSIITLTVAQRYLSFSMIAMLFLEMVFVLVILLVGVISLRKNTRIAELIEEDQFQLMIKRYVILIVSTVTRFLIDGAFMLINIDTFTQDHTTCVFSQKDPNEALNIIMMLLESILTHFLPIIILYRVYSITEDQIKPSDSLLAVQPYKSESDSISDGA